MSNVKIVTQMNRIVVNPVGSSVTVVSRTQHIVVNPATSSVSVINAGPMGPQGIRGIDGVQGETGPKNHQFVTDTAPVADAPGDQWFNSSNGREYVWYDNFWVEIGTSFQGSNFQTAIDLAVANLINGAPGALNTLLELATAMGNDPNFATTMINALAGKQPLDSVNLTAIAALITTPYGRSLLTLANGAALANEAALKAALDSRYASRVTPVVRVYNNATQALGAGINYVTFNSERYDSFGCHDPAVNPTRIQCPAGWAGSWAVGAHMSVDANPARYMWLAQNRAIVLATAWGTATATEMHCTTICQLGVGDYLEVYIQGGAGTLASGVSNQQYCDFWAHWIGPIS